MGKVQNAKNRDFIEYFFFQLECHDVVLLEYLLIQSLRNMLNIVQQNYKNK